ESGLLWRGRATAPSGGGASTGRHASRRPALAALQRSVRDRACAAARRRAGARSRSRSLPGEKSCQQCNLLVREWPHLGATNHERANGLVLPQQGNGENGPVSEAARVRAAIGELVDGRLEVVHVDRFLINEGAPSDPAAPDRRTDKIHWDRAVMSSDVKPFTLT